MIIYHTGAAYLLQQFDQEIQDFAETVHEYSSSAVIDTTEVTRLAGKFTNLLQDYTDIETKANSTYFSITDLVSITKVSGTKFEQQMAKTKKVLSNTTKWMTEFNGKQGKTQAGFNEILSKQKAELASLNNAVVTNKSGQVSGIISVGAQKMYQMKDFKKSVKTGHAMVAKLKKKYDMEYHGAKYLWQEYSGSKISEEVSNLLNKNETLKTLFENTVFGRAYTESKQVKNLIEKFKHRYDEGGLFGQYGKLSYRSRIYLKHGVNELKNEIEKNEKLKPWMKDAKKYWKNNSIGFDKAVYKVKSVRKKGYALIKNKNVAASVSRIESHASKFVHPIKSGLAYINNKIPIIGVSKAAGKIAWPIMIYDSVKDGAKAYFNKDGLGYKSIGKSAIHVGLDRIKKAGPITGFMVGATMGQIGAIAGATAGTLNVIYRKMAPKVVNKSYEDKEEKVDKVYDSTIKKVKNYCKSILEKWKDATKNVRKEPNYG